MNMYRPVYVISPPIYDKLPSRNSLSYFIKQLRNTHRVNALNILYLIFFFFFFFFLLLLLLLLLFTRRVNGINILYLFILIVINIIYLPC